ncbi:GGDEF domain-containing protein [Aureimonas glaciei]|uniref:diguanylate cyclase n=1 Tax=Aureimonas glaciei TaxID=1776957 RepID=A0A916Y4R0_9HYPH|nr:GGDEF domain-containing protein [Aureimonas glaciei]GGD31160.1 GGDEF domain-containing protein [Aureimonas glaciei]
MTEDQKRRSFRWLGLSATGWPRVIVFTILGTILCVGVTLLVGSVNIPDLTPQQHRHALIVDLMLPVVLAAPLLFLAMFLMRELAVAYGRLMVVATTDVLTDVLNRRAFTALVETSLKQTSEGWPSGALLVIDADNFKMINDRLGHERGDVALKIIAAAIKTNVRERDLVGRIGGEEFAVLLRDVGTADASDAAERIRKGVCDAIFKADGISWPLTISVGGVIFRSAASYDVLFVRADRQLYIAKAEGRNRVSLERLDAGPSGV